MSTGPDATRWVRRLYLGGAVSNALVTLPAFFAYDRYVGSFARDREVTYPFLVRIWSGMALLWGVSFLEIARAPHERNVLLKYSYLEKLVTSACVVDAYRRGEVPARLVALVFFTDVVWIPMFAVAHRRVARSQAEPR
jgi:hypothetical protein